MTNQEAGFWILAIGLLLCLSAIVILIWDKRRKYKYKESVMGTVISHKRCHTDTGQGSISYPCAVVEYEADGRKYQCIQRYSMIYYNSVKRAEYDWEIVIADNRSTDGTRELLREIASRIQFKFIRKYHFIFCRRNHRQEHPLLKLFRINVSLSADFFHKGLLIVCIVNSKTVIIPQPVNKTSQNSDAGGMESTYPDTL